MTLDDAYIEKLKAQLKVCDSAVQRWGHKVEAAPPPLRPQLLSELNAVRTKVTTVRERLSQLSTARAGAWHNGKAGLETAWSELSQALEQATLKFHL
jgi:hypothetical protein